VLDDEDDGDPLKEDGDPEMFCSQYPLEQGDNLDVQSRYQDGASSVGSRTSGRWMHGRGARSIGSTESALDIDRASAL